MKERYKSWGAEDCYTLLKALELRLSALGYHIAMVGGARDYRPELELIVYPNVKPADHTSIRSLLAATELQLRGIDKLAKPKKFGEELLHVVSRYEHGRGKNMRVALVYFQEAPPEALETASSPSPTT